MCFSTSSSAKRRPRSASFRGPKMWKSDVMKSCCRENKGEQSTTKLQLPPLCADWCVIWRFHTAGGLDSPSCLAEPFEFVASTSLMSAHIAWTSTSSANLHCYCVEGARLTRAPIILVELHSVAIKRVRKEILTALRRKKKKIRGITFVPTFVSLLSNPVL